MKPTLNLRQLEILRAVVRHRTTVAAAEELGLSQPAVSNALKSMESQIGFPLFDRVNNRLFPTDEATILCQDIDSIFSLHGRIETKLQSMRDSKSGHLSIIATPPLGYSIIPPALAAFLATRPDAQVYFDVRRYEGVVEGVASHIAELGFAIGLAPHPGINFEVVNEAEMVCAMHPDHPLAARDSLGPADLAGYPFIALERGTQLGEAVRDTFAKAGVPFRANVEVRYCNTACVLVAAGLGVAVVDPYSPVHGADHRVVVRPFVPRTPATSYLIWSEARPLSRLAKAFLQELWSISPRDPQS